MGALVFSVCLLLAVGYVAILAFPNMAKSILPWLPWSAGGIRFAAVSAVVLAAFLTVVMIGAWIGWTMATTPPARSMKESKKELRQPQENDEAGSQS